MMYVDSIVDEVHQIRHAILAEYGCDMKAYNLALSQNPLTGFKVVRLEPAKPFAWNRGERPSRLNVAAGVWSFQSTTRMKGIVRK